MRRILRRSGTAKMRRLKAVSWRSREVIYIWSGERVDRNVCMDSGARMKGAGGGDT